MKTIIGHKIKHREVPNDKFETPEALVKECLSFISLKEADIVLDPCLGNGVWYKNIIGKKEWCEIERGIDFFDFNEKIDWIISNPPYSDLDNWLNHSFEIAKKGVAYLLGVNNFTAKRMELANKMGFGLTKLSMFKVFKWWGLSYFLVWEKGKKDIISYNRKVWR
jgi:hypothetical protein